MATLTKGKNFTSGELVTPQKLHELVDLGSVSNIVNSDISNAAAITDDKLSTISSAGKVANAATTATSANAGNAIVARDASGNFSASTITASLSGNAATATKLATARTINGVAFDGSANITIATGVSGTVPITQGGTGATTASDARTNLGAAASSHTHAVATTSADGFMSSTDKSKLDGIPSGGGGGTNDASNITTGTLSNARTTATSSAIVDTIVSRSALGGISLGRPSDPTGLALDGWGEIWSLNGTNYGILKPGHVSLSNNGAAGTVYVQFSGGGNTAGFISKTSPTSVAYSTSSDYRLKTNLEPISNAIKRILQIPDHRFNWTHDPTGKKVDGFLAHEAQAVVPECVVGTKDEVDAEGKPKYQGIDQSTLVPLLLAAVQELAARVAAFEAR